MAVELRPSILHAGVEIQRRRAGRDETPETARRYLARGNAFLSSLDYEGALEIARTSGWAVFSSAERTATAFRDTLDAMIRSASPAWAMLIPIGRELVRRAVGEDGWQCFAIAGLDAEDDAAVEWWDRAAEVVRSQQRSRMLAFGREAERQSLLFERERLVGTGLEPRWVSLEDNRLAYDIQSWAHPRDPSGLDGRTYIEVKGSVRGEEIHLSRAEWDVADARGPRWRLHIWIGDNLVPVVLSVDDVRVHIPSDQGGGSWESVRVRIAALVPRNLHYPAP